MFEQQIKTENSINLSISVADGTARNWIWFLNDRKICNDTSFR
jgi:hypothetical protein